MALVAGSGPAAAVRHATAARARSRAGLISSASVFWVMDMAWSDGGTLVVDALGDTGNEGDPYSTRALLIDSGLSTVKDFGAGHRSVWVK